MIQPTLDRVLVKPEEAPEKSEGGIIFTDQTRDKDKPCKGTVEAVGPGFYHPKTGERVPVGVQKGDTVLWGRYDGTEVEVNGEKFKILFDREIIARLT